MTPLILIAAGIGALAVLYMSRPLTRKRKVSAARFFTDLPPPPKQRFSFGRMLRSRAFYVQLLVLGLFLLAVYGRDWTLSGTESSKALGVWLVLDTSSSMAAVQGGKSRMELAQAEAAAFLKQLGSRAGFAGTEQSACIRLSAFDLDLREIAVARTTGAIEGALSGIEARAVGTDVQLPLGLLTRALDEQCPISHVVVISDQPAPRRRAAANVRAGERQLIWRDISKPVDNTGITAISAEQNPITGRVQRVTIEVTSFGAPPGKMTLTGKGPDGVEPFEREIRFGRTGIGRVSFVPEKAGLYTLELTPGDNYGADNVAAIRVPDPTRFGIEWRLPNPPLAPLPPVAEGAKPDLVVTTPGDRNMPSGPVVLVGDNYDKQKVARIVGFLEGSPLLSDVNFDALEFAGVAGAKLPDGFIPVLTGQDGVWIARHATKPAVYVPGPPSTGRDAVGRVKTTVFYNALRWAIATPVAPLYTLTTPKAPKPEGNRVALHLDEGRLNLAARSVGAYADIAPIDVGGKPRPAWPLLLLAAAVLFLIERALTFFGGERWR